MRDTYSLCETKARLSAIIRRVREGQRAIVTVHGEPAARKPGALKRFLADRGM